MGAMAPDPSLTERGQLLEGLLLALRVADQSRAVEVVDKALKLGWTVDDVRFHLITPALYEVGARWERGEIGVADEHLASSICDWLLFALAGRVRRPRPTGRRALVGCSEGELHALGARMIAHLLSERGWTVMLLGADTPAPAWSQIVRARRPDVAVLSTTTVGVLDQVGPALHAIKTARPECRTVIGGQAYARLPSPSGSFGADLVALDARTLPQRLLEPTPP
jgi:MerR family transcriptional regulator, light-induced transcriptional regulator